MEASIQLALHPVSVHVIKAADLKLLEFYSTFEQLHGKQACTPNMHMHCHLMECILNYGPASAFWLYPFERYNGVMQSFVGNWMDDARNANDEAIYCISKGLVILSTFASIVSHFIGSTHSSSWSIEVIH